MKFAYITAIASILFSTNAFSHEDISYSYLDVAYLGYDIDSDFGDVDPNGLRLKLSVEVFSSMFLVVDRNDADGRSSDVGFDMKTQGYGFGFRGDSWYASYTYNDWKFDTLDTKVDTSVDTLRVGFRRNVTDYMEFNASYSWNDINDYSNEGGLQLGLVFKLYDFLSFTTEYETIGGDLGVDALSAGLRLSF